MKDALGRVLRVGDCVCYPSMNKGVLDLQFSVIAEIREASLSVKHWSGKDSAFKRSSVVRCDRLVKVPTDQVYMAAMTMADDEKCEEMRVLYRLATSIDDLT